MKKIIYTLGAGNLLTFLILVSTMTAVIGGCKKDELETSPAGEKKVTVTTVAGEGTPSFTNGPALSATFNRPRNIAVAADGTIFVSDVVNRCIRKIAVGEVSSFAGSGGGYDIINGDGLIAKFRIPLSIAADRNGNLYSTDGDDGRIRKISAAAFVSTYAGTEDGGFTDGGLDIARFKPGSYIIADGQGNLYMSDAGNNRIRKININNNTVTTIAGNAVRGFQEGNAATAEFNNPGGIAIDKDGNLYIADRGNFRIRKITPAGDVSTLAGGTQGDKDGNAAEAQFSLEMHDMVVDSKGNIFIADDNRIRKVSPQGVVSTIAGTTTPGYRDGDGSIARFNIATGLAIDAQDNIYVADFINNRIRKISFE
jgi:serine/threonine protein kinase, bacterial